MLRRSDFLSKGHFDSSPDEIYARQQAAKWMNLLLAEGGPICDTLFNLAGWICGSLPELSARLQKDLVPPKGRDREATSIRKDLKELAEVYSHRLDDELENLYADHPQLQSQIRDRLMVYADEIIAQPEVSEGRKFLDRLNTVFGLDAKALEFCYFAFALGNYRAVECYFEDTVEVETYCRRQILAKLFDLSAGKMQGLRQQLVGMGILEDSSRLRLNDNIIEALQTPTLKSFQDFFCKPLPKTTLTIDQFHLEPEQKLYAMRLLENPGKSPVHLLLYGAPGCGKTSFAACLAQTLDLKAWGVHCGENDDVQDRRASLSACLRVAAQHKNSFVLVDEAERILDTSARDMREGSSKGWINSLMERKDTHIIWITNEVYHLDPAVKRRFSYSIHFKNPGVGESLSMWNEVCKREKAEKKLPPEARERLARLYTVPVATMEMAIRQARKIASRKDFVACVEEAVKAQVLLRQNGTSQKVVEKTEKPYDENGVCATTPASELLKRGQRISDELKSNPRPRLGTMLFYGPPGTGKTALARHLAKSIGKDLIVCHANDLLGPYVGMTERAIARVFEEAEHDDAVLLIDEADSFIFSRESASHSWEVSMVNQFLTMLENFKGICICTTNFRKDLDQAVMRRFTTKVEFGYARPEQLCSLYQTILEPLAGSPLDDASRELLCRQKCLAPGDFDAVALRMTFEEKPAHSALVAALIDEQKLKLENGAKNLGF